MSGWTGRALGVHGTVHGGTQGQDGGSACQGTGGGHHPRLREAGGAGPGAALECPGDPDAGQEHGGDRVPQTLGQGRAPQDVDRTQGGGRERGRQEGDGWPPATCRGPLARRGPAGTSLPRAAGRPVRARRGDAQGQEGGDQAQGRHLGGGQVQVVVEVVGVGQASAHGQGPEVDVPADPVGAGHQEGVGQREATGGTVDQSPRAEGGGHAEHAAYQGAFPRAAGLVVGRPAAPEGGGVVGGRSVGVQGRLVPLAVRGLTQGGVELGQVLGEGGRGRAEVGADLGDVVAQRVRCRRAAWCRGGRLGRGYLGRLPCLRAGRRSGGVRARGTAGIVRVARGGAHDCVSFPAGSRRTAAMSEVRACQVERWALRRRTPSGVRR